MLFNSLTFVVFFVVVVSAYWMMRSWRARKNLLVIASYIFYGAWNPPFAALLFATTAMDFYLGAGSRTTGAPGNAQSLAGRQRRGEPEHAGVLQVREFPPREFPVGAGARRHRRISRRISISFCRSASRSTLSIRSPTRSISIAA